MRTPFLPPTGLVSDDTVFAAPGRWKDASMARFYDGNWQTVGGWESLILTLLGGVCRAVFAWSDSANFLNIAFGTHQTLEVWQGGMKYVITPAAFVPGAIDGTGGAGEGTGTYGTGTYGSPSTADYWPLTWSFGAFGQQLIANPRGQGVFVWANVTGTPAIPLTNAPAKATYTLCVPQRQVMCFGCSRESDGVFDQLAIRWSDIEDATSWTTLPDNNAGEYILEGGGRIVCARVIGDYVFVWTDVALYLGTYIGSPDQTWSFTKIGDHCGSISPGGPVVTGQTAAWISPDAQFWSCGLGGAPQQMDCPIRKDFADNISQGQFDKIVGATIGTYQEVRWFYPDARDGLENSRDICLNPQGWCRGRLDRTAFVDAGPADSPIGTTAAGNIYWHERGNSADGGVITGFMESTDFYLDEAEAGLMINGIWPNFKDQVGALTLTIYGREYPQSTERSYGPWTLVPGMAKKSFRLSARVVRVRIDWATSPAYARGGKQEFDVEAIGGR